MKELCKKIKRANRVNARLRVTTVGVILLSGALALTTVACPDTSNGDQAANSTEHSLGNAGSTSPTEYNYICTNGTPQSGTTAEENTEQCAECDSGYIADGERCAVAYNYMCDNGEPSEEQTATENTTKCSLCHDFFKLESDACVATVYTCSNGVVADGSPNATDDSAVSDTNADIEKCTSCDFGYVLSDGECVAFSLTHIRRVLDGDAHEIDGVQSISTATIGDTNYFFVAGYGDDGVSVFSIDSNGIVNDNIDHVDDDDNASYELDNPFATATTTIGNTTYLFVAAFLDNGVTVFSVSDTDGTLTFVDSVDDSDGNYELNRARSITTAAMGSTTYLFVAGQSDDGVSIFSVSDTDGTLTHVAAIDDSDNADYQLDGAHSVATTTIDSTTYLFVAGYEDDGISVFSISGTDGTPTYVSSVTDDASYNLDGVRSITTTTVSDTRYLIAASDVDDGISVFSIGESDGALSHVISIDDNDDNDYELDGAYYVSTDIIGITPYLFVAGNQDNGVSTFSMNNDGTLNHVVSVNDGDDSNYLLSGSRSVATITAGAHTYLMVGGYAENGISVFAIP